MKQSVTLSDLAAIVGRNEQTLRRWAREGTMEATLISGRIYVVDIPLFLESVSGGALAAYFTVAELKQMREVLGGVVA